MELKKQILAGTISLFAIVGMVVAPVPVSALECSVLPSGICDAADEGELEQSGIWLLLIMIINILTILIGLIAVAAIVYAGFLYVSAQDKQEQVKKSKDMITNTIIGLVLYGFMYSLLQWLVPGGVFN